MYEVRKPGIFEVHHAQVTGRHAMQDVTEKMSVRAGFPHDRRVVHVNREAFVECQCTYGGEEHLIRANWPFLSDLVSGWKPSHGEMINPGE